MEMSGTTEQQLVFLSTHWGAYRKTTKTVWVKVDPVSDGQERV